MVTRRANGTRIDHRRRRKRSRPPGRSKWVSSKPEEPRTSAGAASGVGSDPATAGAVGRARGGGEARGSSGGDRLQASERLLGVAVVVVEVPLLEQHILLAAA